MNSFELEDRLLEFAVFVSKIALTCNKEEGIEHLAEQLNRSSSSSVLNYAEVRGAQST
ncbi:MAG: four helix bundle protein [Bacteroidetes bacterium]|nr:four helix bundle protein [Bacteroidota bacterium]